MSWHTPLCSLTRWMVYSEISPTVLQKLTCSTKIELFAGVIRQRYDYWHIEMLLWVGKSDVNVMIEDKYCER